MPNAMVISTTATGISVSWTVPGGSVVERYEVVWEKNSPEECLDEDVSSTTITDGSTSTTITGLEAATSYAIIVAVNNGTGSIASDRAIVTTGRASSRAGSITYTVYQ